jgi:predicted metal-dependent hydrolase
MTAAAVTRSTGERQAGRLAWARLRILGARSARAAARRSRRRWAAVGAGRDTNHLDALQDTTARGSPRHDDGSLLAHPRAEAPDLAGTFGPVGPPHSAALLPCRRALTYDASMADRPRTLLQGGRAKAFRPMPSGARREALEAGLAAYGRGDCFLAHELLEPAWMGAHDHAERELLQGLIKLSAAFVHAARGNPLGVEKNLRGAAARIAAGASAGPELAIDVPPLLTAVNHRLAAGIRASDGPIPIGRTGSGAA